MGVVLVFGIAAQVLVEIVGVGALQAVEVTVPAAVGGVDAREELLAEVGKVVG